jgi:hypothetical protein
MVFGFLLAAAAIGIVNTGCNWVHKFAVRKEYDKLAADLQAKGQQPPIELRLVCTTDELREIRKGDFTHLTKGFARFEALDPQLEHCARCKKPVTNLAAYLGGTS